MDGGAGTKSRGPTVSGRPLFYAVVELIGIEPTTS